jgi:hypothetical protein
MKSLEHNGGKELPLTIKTDNRVIDFPISHKNGVIPTPKTDDRKVYVVMNGQTQYDKDTR